MKLKPGVEIVYKRKKYSREIPDDIFQEIYGENEETLTRFKQKFEFQESQESPDES
jgi:hypothetical protein